MFTRTAKWRELSAMLMSSRCLLGIMKMCSLCRFRSVALALCPAWPGPVRLTPSDPRNYWIAKSLNSRGAHFWPNHESLGSAARFRRFDQPWAQPPLAKSWQAKNQALMIVFIFSSIFAFFSNLCVFSPTPPKFSSPQFWLHKDSSIAQQGDKGA